jgi:hypothetical protein
MRDKPIKLILAVVALLATTTVVADDFSLDWWTIDGGGEMWTVGGDFELSGTIGQPDASTVAMTGGDFELSGGFWPGTKFCLGDLNGDGVINLGDLGILLAHYGQSGMTYEEGDLTGDGNVNLADLGVLLAAYGTVCP